MDSKTDYWDQEEIANNLTEMVKTVYVERMEIFNELEHLMNTNRRKMKWYMKIQCLKWSVKWNRIFLIWMQNCVRL